MKLQPLHILKVDEVIAVDTTTFNKHNNLDDLLDAIKHDSYISNYDLREIIILSNKDYLNFVSDFFAKHYFLENLYGRYTRDQNWLCLIVFNKDTQAMVAIDTQGFEYSRYTGIVQNEDKIRELVKSHLTQVPIKDQDKLKELIDLVTANYPNITFNDIYYALNPINGIFVATLNFIECDRQFRKITPIEYILKHDPTFETTLNVAKIKHGNLNPNHKSLTELANFLYIHNLSVDTLISKLYNLVDDLIPLP